MYVQFLARALTLGLFVATGCTPARHPPASGAKSTPAGSQSSVQTHPLAMTQPIRGLLLTLDADITSVAAGDKIEFTERLTNVSDHIIWENFRGFFRHAVPGFASDDDVPGLDRMVTTSSHYARKMVPGEARVVRYKFTILVPGRYRFFSEWDASYSANREEDLWKGELRSNCVDVTVVSRKN